MAARSAAAIEAWLVEQLAAVLPSGLAIIDSDTHLLDTGLDSIEAVGLAEALETWLGQPVGDDIVWQFPTVGALARALAGSDAPRPPVRHDGHTTADGHPFATFVNPPLASLLQQLHLDKRFVRGDGCQLFDEQGRAYLDFVAAYGALPFGHNPPEIWRAVTELRDRGEPNFVQPSLLDPAGALAARLVELTPPHLCHVTFANSGAEAIEAAIKMCRLATGRLGILSTRGGFHGKTLAALSATHDPRHRAGTGAPADGFDAIPFGDADALRRAFAARPGYYAGFVVEPIQGEGGIVEPPPGYLAAVRAACDEAGVLLVFDEIQTGLGRTGAWFACDHDGVSPDVMTLAKALGGGLVPIGAAVASDAAWSDDFGRQHSSTFAGGALACRVALAALDRLAGDDAALIQRVSSLGQQLKNGLTAAASRFPHLVGDVRGRGFLLGLRLSAHRGTWPSSLLGIAGEEGGLAPLFASYLLNVEGLRVAPTLNGRDVVRIEPPLTATAEDCRRAVDAIARALEVFATGDTARVLGSIRARRPLPATRAPARTDAVARAHRPHPRHNEPRFGFILHPLDLTSYADFDPTLATLPADELREAARCLHGLADPAVVADARIESPTGATAYGEFIVIGHTARELASMPHAQAVAAVRAGVELARKRGAHIVGLGAFTSIVTQGGLALRDAGVPVTSGNGYTVVAAEQAIAAATGAHRIDAPSIALLGAGGSIGRALAARLLSSAAQLTLVGNPARSADYVRDQLTDVVAAACHHLIASAGPSVPGPLGRQLLASPDCPDAHAPPAAFTTFAKTVLARGGDLLITRDAARAARQANVVVTATSATDVVLRSGDLRPDAILCELSRPRNLGPTLALERPDVTVIDGGVVALPGRPDIGSFGLPLGHAYACMSETMLLALAGEPSLASLGGRLSLAHLHRLHQLGETHGFQVVSERAGAPACGASLPSAAPARASG